MPRIDKYNLTEKQQEAVKHLVVDHWGWNMQSGYDIEEDAMYLYAQEGPNLPVQGWTILVDGSVIPRT